MQGLSKRELILLAIFLSLLLFLGGYKYVYEPFAVQIQELTTEREQLKGKWQEIESWADRLPELQERTEKVKTEIAQLEHAFMVDGQTADFWEAMEHTAGKSHVNIVRIQEGEASDRKGEETTTSILEIEGNSAAVQQFLHQLENLPYSYAMTRGEWAIENSMVKATILFQWAGVAN